jgi:hypothetical protein
MAVDSSGRLHLAFYDTHSHNLEYVVRSASGVWSDVKIVDKSATSVTYVSLALDRKGIPGIAYYDAKNADLKYARLSGGAFSVTRIDSKGSVGESPSLAYTSANKPAISYYSRSGGNLKLAVLGKSKWTLSTIDSSGNTGKYTSLALNSKTGGWGIAYLNATTGILRYAEKGKTGAWKFTNIEKIGGSNSYTSLAFDTKARPAISYYVSGPADLHYAHFDGRKWTHQTVASSGGVGQYNSLMFDSSGIANIFFYNQNSNAPMRATAHKGSWLLSSIARGGGTFLSAAAGPGDAETFVYRDSASGTLLAGAV